MTKLTVNVQQEDRHHVYVIFSLCELLFSDRLARSVLDSWLNTMN